MKVVCCCLVNSISIAHFATVIVVATFLACLFCFSFLLVFLINYLSLNFYFHTKHGALTKLAQFFLITKHWKYSTLPLFINEISTNHLSPSESLVNLFKLFTNMATKILISNTKTWWMISNMKNLKQNYFELNIWW